MKKDAGVSFPYLYLATDGVLLKIGVSEDPDKRVSTMHSPRLKGGKFCKATLIRYWVMFGYAIEGERAVKKHFKARCVGSHASEWFRRTTVEEMVEFVDKFKACLSGYHP